MQLLVLTPSRVLLELAIYEYLLVHDRTFETDWQRYRINFMSWRKIYHVLFGEVRALLKPAHARRAKPTRTR